MFRQLAFGAIPLGACLGAFTVPCSAAQLSDVEHIIVIYLENHSFDNLFGFFRTPTASPRPERPKSKLIRRDIPTRFSHQCSTS